MLILRIRQAECALADGRLDEAFELADRHDVRSHRRGQRLVGRLVRSLVERGGKHLEAGRLTDAASDSEKARRFGGLMADVAALRERIAAAMMAKHRGARRQARLVAAARHQIDNGNLAGGGTLLAGLGREESAVGVMLHDIELRRAALGAAVANADGALKRDDWEAAVRELARVRPADTSADATFAALAGKLGRFVRQRAHEALVDGDVRLAGAMLERLSTVDDHCVETQRLCELVAQCRLAWSHLDRSQPRQAEEVVRRVAALLPGAKWPTAVARQLREAAELMDELRAGPLGLCGVASAGRTASDQTLPKVLAGNGSSRVSPPPIPRHFTRQPAMFANSVPSPQNDVSGDALPPRFLLQVDGAGSFLVFTQPQVTLGAISSSKQPDIALLAEGTASVAKVERVEDDYFLRGSGPMAVNGRSCAGKMLASGDQIALSPRCRFTFRQPSAASTSAVLDLTGTRYPRADVRRVILLDRELVVGRGAGAHVRIDELPVRIVLQVRDGRLFAQTKEPIWVGGQEVVARTAIPVGLHVKAGGLSFVVTRA